MNTDENNTVIITPNTSEMMLFPTLISDAQQKQHTSNSSSSTGSNNTGSCTCSKSINSNNESMRAITQNDEIVAVVTTTTTTTDGGGEGGPSSIATLLLDTTRTATADITGIIVDGHDDIPEQWYALCTNETKYYKKVDYLNNSKQLQQHNQNNIKSKQHSNYDGSTCSTSTRTRSSSNRSNMIDISCRSKMISWCYDVIDFCNYNRSTTGEACVHYIDRYLSIISQLDSTCTETNTNTSALYDTCTFQLVCMTCLYIVSKVYETKVMDSDLIAALSYDMYTSIEIENMEYTICSSIFNWTLHPPTSYQFVIVLIQLLPDTLLNSILQCNTSTSTTPSTSNSSIVQNNIALLQPLRIKIQQIALQQTEIAIQQYKYITIKTSIISYCSVLNAIDTILNNSINNYNNNNMHHQYHRHHQHQHQQQVRLLQNDIQEQIQSIFSFIIHPTGRPTPSANNTLDENGNKTANVRQQFCCTCTGTTYDEIYMIRESLYESCLERIQQIQLNKQIRFNYYYPTTTSVQVEEAAVVTTSLTSDRLLQQPTVDKDTYNNTCNKQQLSSTNSIVASSSSSSSKRQQLHSQQHLQQNYDTCCYSNEGMDSNNTTTTTQTTATTISPTFVGYDVNLW